MANYKIQSLLFNQKKKLVPGNPLFLPTIRFPKYLQAFTIIGCLMISHLAFSQDTTESKKAAPKMYVVETIDGTTLNGTVISENDSVLILNTKAIGQVTLQKQNLKSIKLIGTDDYVDGVYWFENPNATRYIVGPSAFNLKKGEGYYQNLYLFGQSVNYGITDHFSIGGGTEIASPIFGGEAPALFFLTPKIGYEVAPKVNLGAGILYIHISDEFADDVINTGILYGVATYGTKNNNFTLGLGWGYYNNKVDIYSNSPPYTRSTKRDKGFATLPTITFSGMTRLSKRFCLTTENWIQPLKSYDYYSSNNSYSFSYKDGAFFSYGMRFMGEKNSIDFGFINNAEIVGEIPIPYIDFVVKFGGEKKKK